MISKEQIKKYSKEEIKHTEDLLKIRKKEMREEERILRNKEAITSGTDRLYKIGNRLLELGLSKDKLKTILNSMIGKLSQQPTKEQK